MADIGDSYTLTIDPDIDSYYLIDTVMNKSPVALERMGQMRAKGTGILTKKQMFDQQKIEMSSLMAELNGAIKTLKVNLEKTAKYNPDLQAVLQQATKDLCRCIGADRQGDRRGHDARCLRDAAEGLFRHDDGGHRQGLQADVRDDAADAGETGRTPDRQASGENCA